MILYEVIKRQVNALHLMEGVAGLPMEININHNLLWLGDILYGEDPDGNELFTVQIRQDKKSLGWLYQNHSIILYRYEGGIYECGLPALKGLVETFLKEKRTASTPEVNTLQKNTLTGEILGYVHMHEVVKISNAIK